MPRYLVSQKIRTVADLFGEYQMAEFNFRPFEPDNGGEGRHAWEVTNDTTAPTFREAFTNSRNQLLPVVDAISVVTECSASLSVTSAFVYRLDDNSDRTIFLYVAERIPAVGIPLWTPEQSRDVEKLRGLDGAAIHYIRDSNNASTPKTRLAMLVIAAEALAGRTQRTSTCPKCRSTAICPKCQKELPPRADTDRGRLREVLGQEAYDALYVRDGGSLRHRLFHGATVSEQTVAEVTGSTYSEIRAFLHREYALESFGKEKIVGAPRTFDNYQHGYHFIRLHDEGIPRLKDLERGWENLGAPLDIEPTAY